MSTTIWFLFVSEFKRDEEEEDGRRSYAFQFHNYVTAIIITFDILCFSFLFVQFGLCLFMFTLLSVYAFLFGAEDDSHIGFWFSAIRLIYISRRADPFLCGLRSTLNQLPHCNWLLCWIRGKTVSVFCHRWEYECKKWFDTAIYSFIWSMKNHIRSDDHEIINMYASHSYIQI